MLWLFWLFWEAVGVLWVFEVWAVEVVVSILSKLPGPQTVSRVCPYFQFSVTCLLDCRQEIFYILHFSQNHKSPPAMFQLVLPCCSGRETIAQPSVSSNPPTDITVCYHQGERGRAGPAEQDQSCSLLGIGGILNFNCEAENLNTITRIL